MIWKIISNLLAGYKINQFSKSMWYQHTCPQSISVVNLRAVAPLLVKMAVPLP